MNLYSRRYLHPDTGRVTRECIDAAEPRDYVRRTLTLVGALQ